MNFNMKQQFWLEVVAVETDTQAHHSTKGNIKNDYIAITDAWRNLLISPFKPATIGGMNTL